MIRKIAIIYKSFGLENNVFSIWGKILLAAILVATSLFMYIPVATTSAMQAVNLDLLGLGASPLSVKQVIPGESGASAVTLNNIGTAEGRVYIWLSNIQSIEGNRPEPGNLGLTGELHKHITLSLYAVGLETNVAFPAVITDFPMSIFATKRMMIPVLPAGGSVDLVWEWHFPETGSSQDEAQGDSLTFDINYYIEELSGTGAMDPTTSTGGGSGILPPDSPLVAPVRSIQVVVPGVGLVTRITGDGSSVIELSGQTAGQAAKTSVTLTIPGGALILNPAKVTGTEGPGAIPEDAVPHKIEIYYYTPAEEIPLPEGWVLVSDVIRILAYTYGIPNPVTIDPPASMVLGYDTELLPEFPEEIALFFYDEQKEEWIQLQQVPGYIAEQGEAAALVGHFSIFAVLAKGNTENVPVDPGVDPGSTPAGAEFVIGNLTVSPSEMYAGEKATVSAIVTNIGGVAGEYRATLALDGQLIAAKTLTIGAGANQLVEFVVNPALPGVYTIEINDLRGRLNVVRIPELLKPDSSNSWWLLLLILAFIIIMSLLFQANSRLSPVYVGSGWRKQFLPTSNVLWVKELVLNPDIVGMESGETATIKAIARYGDDSKEDVTAKVIWKIKDQKIARIDDAGQIKAKAAGSTTITVGWQNRVTELTLCVNCTPLSKHLPVRTVVAPVNGRNGIQSITITPREQTIKIGEKQTFRATVLFADGITEDVTPDAIWSSTNDFVADINRKGVAMGYSAGATAIIATYRGRKGIATLIVIRNIT